MKKHHFFISLCATIVFLVGAVDAQNIRDWENPDVNGINKEQPHAYGFLAEEKSNNPLIRSLNGIWKFKWSPDPQSRPVEFYTESYPTDTWDNILVPGLQPLCFRAWPYSEDDVGNTRHDYQLPHRDFINLNIDLNIHDVGGDDTWGAKTMEKYTNPVTKLYRYGFIMEYAGVQ